MTQLELFNQTCAHEPHEKFLFYASFTPDARKAIITHLGLDEDADIRESLDMFSPSAVNLRNPRTAEKSDFTQYYEDVDQPEGSYIDSIGVLHVPGSMYHFTHYVSPLRKATSLSEVEDFEFPDNSNASDEHMKEEVDAIHARGRVAQLSVTHMYEEAWQVRGYEEFLMDMHANPEICEFVLDRFTERNIRRAEAAARAGVDLLRTGDDVANQQNMMFCVDHWRRFIKSRWAKVYSAAKTINPDIKIWYHSDGNIEAIIPELIEIGVDILNPVQPECLDLLPLKKEYGDQLVFDGTIGTQTTMPFGTPEDVRNCVMERKETLGQDGALILSPTHILEPEVSPENMVAFFDACK